MNRQSLFRIASVGLAAAAGLAIACSQGSPSQPSGISGGQGGEGWVGATAVGDTKTGTGALELIRLRMDRQSTPGVLGIRQFVNPNGAYRYEPGESIELWAEWDANNGYLGTTIPRNPRMYVEWGLPGVEMEWTNCGACRLTRRYEPRGRFMVRVSLDDLSGTRVTRTFFLDASLPEPTPTPTPEASPTPTPDTQYTITITSLAAAGGGKGQVTDSTGGLLAAEPSGCGPSPLKSPCTFTVNWGTVVSIYAIPDGQSPPGIGSLAQQIDYVESWAGDCAGSPVGSPADPATKTCSLGAVMANKTVTVTFAKDAVPTILK